MKNRFQVLPLEGLVNFKTGKLNSNAAKPDGMFPFFTCSQETFRTDTWSFDGEYVLLAGNNAAGIYPLKYFNGKFDAYQRTYVIRTIDENVFVTRYGYYALRLQLELMKSISTGVATKFLTLSLLNQTQIPIPPLPTQKKIAAILSAYDDLIENNERRIKILEAMAQNLYREWFVKFRFPGHEKVKMVDSPLGKIPQGWEVRKFGDVCSIQKNKYEEERHGALPLVDLSRMPSRTLAIRETGMPQELTTSRIVFDEDDVLFGAIRPYLHKVVLAPCSGVTNVSVFVLRARTPILATLLAVVASSADTVRWADQHSTGTKMPVIQWELFSRMPVIMPDAVLLDRFRSCAAPMLLLLKKLAIRNAVLRKTRDLLLPRMISGDVDVSELAIKISES